ncbi:hypothetical protein ACYOEI_25090 [Singulisphaera rosea]
MHGTIRGSKLAAAITMIGGLLATGCGQTAPSPSTPVKKAVSTDAGLYCKEHGVPEKFCTLCHEELKGKLVACKEHGDLPEDI